MSSTLKILRQNQEHLREAINKAIESDEEIQFEVDSIIKHAYESNLYDNLKNNPNYKYVYKLNQALNAFTPTLKSIQSKKSEGRPSIEDVLPDKQKIILRFISSLHYLSSEIQLLIEQSYTLQALGRLRLLLEELIIFSLTMENTDIYSDALEFGNYAWGPFEDFFHPNITDETKAFTEYMKNKYGDKHLKNRHYWIEKNIGRPFVATHEFKRLFSEDLILMYAWTQSHNFNHAGSMLLALDDKQGLYEPMSKYANPIILFFIFKTFNIVFSQFDNEFTEQSKEIFHKLKMTPIIEMIDEIGVFVQKVVDAEVSLFHFLKARKDINGSKTPAQ